MRHGCFAVGLQKCLVDYKTSCSISMERGDNDWIAIFKWTFLLRQKIKLFSRSYRVKHYLYRSVSESIPTKKWKLASIWSFAFWNKHLRLSADSTEIPKTKVVVCKACLNGMGNSQRQHVDCHAQTWCNEVRRCLSTVHWGLSASFTLLPFPSSSSVVS